MIIIGVILWNSTDVNVWGIPAIERPLKRHTMGGFPHNLEVLHGQLTRLSQVHWFKGLLCLKSKWRMATLQAGWTKWDYDPASRLQPQGRPPPTASEENFYQVQSFFHSPNPQKDHNAFFQDFSDYFILLIRKFQVFSGCFLHRLTNQRPIPRASRAAHVQWTGFPGKTLLFYNRLRSG